MPVPSVRAAIAAIQVPPDRAAAVVDRAAAAVDRAAAVVDRAAAAVDRAVVAVPNRTKLIGKPNGFHLLRMPIDDNLTKINTNRPTPRKVKRSV